ncbi:MAG: Gfo/Idh/MocA family oxidoreductase [Phycisphaerae bacterium]|nr:Gfo/Idh/MocA family oxidoreductase [Phycisphaerae bacterium]
MTGERTRRELLRDSLLAATGLAVAGSPLKARGAWANAPIEKLNVGVIGLSNQGRNNLGRVGKEHVVAICDVDERDIEHARDLHPQATFYRDFRRMIDREKLDAVVVSTPDHTHAVATMAALRSGLHVYCEKPLAHTVHEAREVAEFAAKTGRITQMGIQMHATPNYRRVVELIRAGTIGPVTEVHVWVSGANAPGDRPEGRPPVPKGLHYDLWLGPAPYRPFHPEYLPIRWRGWWDFGEGKLGDFGCHLLDLAHWALDLRHPSVIEAEGPPVNAESAPRWLKVRWQYPARPEKPPVSVHWYDGDKRPSLLSAEILDKWKGKGVLFVGREGQLLADYGQHVLLPREKFADFKPPAPSIPPSIGHHKEWIEACKTGDRTSCGFDYAGPLAEAVLLGVVAYRSGKRIEWDAEKLKITNAPEAEKYLHYEYRKGWTL